MGKKRLFALEEEKKKALFELWVAILLLIAFTVLDIAIYLLEPLYTFITSFYGPHVTASLIHASFLLMTALLWLVYRRWKEADQIVSELEGVLASLSSHVLLVVDPDGTIRRCTRSIEKVFGYEMAEVVHQKTSFLYDGQWANRSHAPASYETLERRGFQVGECLGKRKDGKTIPLEVITGRLTGRPGTVVLLRDVSERKFLDEEWLQRQKLEALGRLAGGIAHDYNNFMTVISGFAKLMKRRMAPSDPSHSELDELLKAADRATALTRQLLAFGRRQVASPRTLNLNEVILNMEKLLRPLIGEDVELAMNLDEKLRPIQADASQLEQVILNLSLNARNAMPKGGRITIETHNIDNIQLDYQGESAPPSPGSGDYVLLAVVDNGSGMSADVRKHLFEPFFTTREKKNGVGLGLATCYGIVQMNRGHIFVSSEPDRGTTVRVYFPSAQGAPEKAAEPKEPEILPRGSETVLVTEDEPSVRAFASQVLREQGYQVIEAANGIEALNLLRQNPRKEIQLLLTDWVMPRMDGEELARRLKGLRPQIKVLFTSGYADPTMIHDGRLEGEEFLQKPFSPHALASRVREVLNRQAF